MQKIVYIVNFIVYILKNMYYKWYTYYMYILIFTNQSHSKLDALDSLTKRPALSYGFSMFVQALELICRDSWPQCDVYKPISNAFLCSLIAYRKLLEASVPTENSVGVLSMIPCWSFEDNFSHIKKNKSLGLNTIQQKNIQKNTYITGTGKSRHKIYNV